MEAQTEQFKVIFTDLHAVEDLPRICRKECPASTFGISSNNIYK